MPPQTYATDTAGATLSGACTDNAGKSGQGSFSLRYDSTPPAVVLTGAPADHGAALQWQATTSLAPLTSLQVVRSPGLKGAGASVLPATGAGGSYADWHLRNRRSYRYTVTATDQAGNTTVQSVVVRPGRRLLTPASGARVTAPPDLSWTAVQRATYYNVQVFRGRKKVLSAWPKQAHLQMGPTWKFRGRRYRLRPGRYRWFVWPGFGRQSAARYGSQIGSGTFIVR